MERFRLSIVLPSASGHQQTTEGERGEGGGLRNLGGDTETLDANLAVGVIVGDPTCIWSVSGRRSLTQRFLLMFSQASRQLGVVRSGPASLRRACSPADQPADQALDDNGYVGTLCAVRSTRRRELRF